MKEFPRITDELMTAEHAMRCAEDHAVRLSRLYSKLRDSGEGTAAYAMEDAFNDAQKLEREMCAAFEEAEERAKNLQAGRGLVRAGLLLFSGAPVFWIPTLLFGWSHTVAWTVTFVLGYFSWSIAFPGWCCLVDAKRPRHSRQQPPAVPLPRRPRPGSARQTATG